MNQPQQQLPHATTNIMSFAKPLSASQDGPSYADPHHHQLPDVRHDVPPRAANHLKKDKNLLEELRKRKRDLEKKFQERSPRQVHSFPSSFLLSRSSSPIITDDMRNMDYLPTHDSTNVNPNNKDPIPLQMSEWWQSSSSSFSSLSSLEKRSSQPSATPVCRNLNEAPFSSSSPPPPPSSLTWENDKELIGLKLKRMWR